MDNPPFLPLGRIPVESEILSEVKTANRYLEILIELLSRAFPQAMTPELSKQIKEAKPIGFGRP